MLNNVILILAYGVLCHPIFNNKKSLQSLVQTLHQFVDYQCHVNYSQDLRNLDRSEDDFPAA